jgi:hypothetical protein
MEMGVDSQPWEGLTGVDSFIPYRVGVSWYAFFGSIHGEGSLDGNPYSGRLMVGLASGPSLDGPWTRMNGNPLLNVEPISIENPIVYHLDDGMLIAIYNAPGWPNYDVGYTTSTDGVHWTAGKHLRLAPEWATSVRTPLSLIAEPDGTCTLIFTAATGSLDAWVDSYHMAVGLAEVKIQ